ncbi:MAG TPA: rhomboid family intramembrane serine protease, partial [Turneriella sp.]|nr:rhomboid family intramembrane serine protease [Turneriella sp.]
MPLSRATFALIVANSIVFLITLSQSARFSEPSLQTLISFGANFAPLTIFHGEVWRLFTSMFLHGGWIHLLVNMYSLYVIGAAVDFICGTKKYIMIYIVAGLAGSVASVMYSLVRL